MGISFSGGFDYGYFGWVVDLNTGNEVSQRRFKLRDSISTVSNVIVSDGDFVSSYSEDSKIRAQKYFWALQLSKSTKNYSEIARQINEPNRTVHGWLSEGQTPWGIKGANKLKNANLLPLVADGSPHFKLFVEIFAFVLGDGTIGKDFSGVGLTGEKEDLEKLKRKIEANFGFTTELEKRETTSVTKKEIKGRHFTQNIVGSSYYLRIHSSPFARLLHLAGAPKGDKVVQSFKLPIWILNAPKEIKRDFLGVLFGNELQCPNIRAKNAFTSPQFGMHKVEGKEEAIVYFLNQLKDLLNEFGISSSKVCLDRSYKTIRKDGLISKKFYFGLDSHSPNIVRLFNEVPFKYASEKKARFADKVEQFFENSKHLQNEWEIYEKVMQMHSSGIGRRKIYKQLGLPKAYFYKINSWVHYGKKPLYYGELDIPETVVKGMM
ncbi:MAG: hypothetical protein NUV67_06100 [archaeon]|nr:hypothetical protein [archaeon]